MDWTLHYQHYLTFCFFAGRFSSSPLLGESSVGAGGSGLLPSSLFFCTSSGAFGFFLTTTPLRDFLVSFLVTGGLGFGGSSFGLGVLGSEFGIGGGGGGPIRAATALWVGRWSERREICTARTHALPEACEFHAVLFFPFSLLLKLALTDRIEEHDFIFLQSTELIS